VTSACGRRGARLSAFLLRAARPRLSTLAALIVMAGCSAPPRGAAPILLKPDLSRLERQARIRIDIIKVRSRPGDLSGKAAPYLGFRVEGDRLRASDDLESLAGMQWPRDAYREWLGALLADGSATIAYTLETLVEPGEPQEIVRGGTRSYIANWRFGPDGIGSVVTERLRPSAKLSLRVSELPGLEPLLVHFDLSIAAAALEKTPVIAPRTRRRGKGTTGLMVQMPRESSRRVATAALVRDRHACVLAHWVRQRRTGPRMPEHLLFVVTVERVGLWEEAPPQPAPPAVRTAGVAHVIWTLPPQPSREIERQAILHPKDTLSEHADVSAFAQPGAPHEIRALLPADPRTLDWLGLAVVEDSEAIYEMTDSQRYVSGLAPPIEGAPPARAFTTRTAATGVRIELRWRRQLDASRIEGTLRLAGPPLMEPVEQSLRSLRQPAGGKLMETYRFTRCLQVEARGMFVLDARSPGTWGIRLPCRVEDNRERQEIQLSRKAFAVFAFRAAPAHPSSPPDEVSDAARGQDANAISGKHAGRMADAAAGDAQEANRRGKGNVPARMLK